MIDNQRKDLIKVYSCNMGIALSHKSELISVKNSTFICFDLKNPPCTNDKKKCRSFYGPHYHLCFLKFEEKKLNSNQRVKSNDFI